jgi:tetratricopeptide (TPR) repeat protein
MASKTTPTRAGKSDEGAGGSLRAEAERLIAKERYKDAVKQAKLCYKEQATPENHRLLERAYFLRARQLVQQGMRASAVEVAQHLIDFGGTESDSPEELVRLLAGLGFEKAALSIQERLGRPELKDQVTQAVADQLVIHPERAGAASPELVKEAGLVRRALEALQAGDEAGSLAMLRDLPRSSPLSEWKLFVRGLAAFERGDDAEVRANWDRLGPGRAPAAIASRLRTMAGEAGGGLEAAEKRAFGEPILDRLRQLGKLVAGHEWDKALTLTGHLRQALRRIDPGLAERLTRALNGSIIKAVQDMDWHDARSLVTRFTRAAEPLAIDPHWNRFWAMIWDGPQAEPGGAIHYWTAYAEDIDTLDVFSPAERALGRAMIWNHIAALRREEVDDLIEDEEGPPGLARLKARRGKKAKTRESSKVGAAKKEVLAALEKSLELAPDHVDTYRLLVSIHEDWEDDKGLESAAERLLGRFPEDVETLQLLAQHHYDRKDNRAALPYVLRARQLKPLDESLRHLERMTHVGMARVYALERKWDEGRAEFAAAEALAPTDPPEFAYLVRRAMFEYKARLDDAGDRYVEQARALLSDPGPIWMALLIESIRFKMPKARSDEYTRLWDVELKKKPKAETAGEMAGLMGSLLHVDVEYTGRAGHIKKIVDYVRKAASLKYRREHMENIVGFLSELMPREHSLFERMAKAGVKQHPDSVPLQMTAGTLEMNKAGMDTLFDMIIPAAVRRHFETALKLAESSSDPKDAALLPEIRERLSMLEEVQEAMDRYGPPFGDMPFGPEDLYDMLDDEAWDDDLEDEFDDAPSPPARLPAPKKPKGTRKKK